MIRNVGLSAFSIIAFDQKSSNETEPWLAQHRHEQRRSSGPDRAARTCSPDPSPARRCRKSSRRCEGRDNPADELRNSLASRSDGRRSTPSMLTQIYEVSTFNEARTISRIGVDHIGVLVGNGEFPRELSVEAAAIVAAGIAPPSKFSALFLTADISLIERWARQLRPAIVHLGAAPELLSPDAASALKGKLPGMLLMRSIPVVSEASIAIAQSYEAIFDRGGSILVLPKQT